MWFYRAFKRNVACDTITLDTAFTGGLVLPKVDMVGDGTTGTTGTAIKIGTSSVPIAINTAGQRGINAFFSSTATSDTTYGMYLRLDSVGAGVEAIAARFKTLLTTGAAQQAHGIHGTLEYGSSGNIVDVGSGIKGNFVVNGRTITGGECYGMIAELYYNTSGSTASVRHAPLCISVAGNATGMATCKNAIAIVGTDGTGNMIYTATDSAPTLTGSIRILVNGVTRYLHYGNAQAANS
jgi:hypothetical protein